MKKDLLLIGLPLSAWLLWQYVFLGNPPRTILFSSPPEPQIPAVLDEPSFVEVVDRPFAEVLAELAKRHGTTIRLDEGMKVYRAIVSRRVTCKLHGVSLRSVLSHLARDAHPRLRVVSWNGTITVTTQDELELPSRRVERLQSIAELMALNEADGIHELVSMLIVATRSHLSGAEVVALSDALLISETPERQAFFADVVARLTELAKQPGATAPVRVGEARTPATEAVERALAQRIDLRFVDAPLSAVAAELEEKLGVPVVVDSQAPLGIPRIFGAITDAPADYALETILAPHSCLAIVRDEALCITADPERSLRLYPVHDLLQREKDVFLLKETIESLVLETNRDPPGEAQVVGSTLAVLEMPAIHRRIEEFLAELRAAFDASGTAAPRVVPGPRQWLKQRITARHEGILWEDFLKQLERQQGFAFRIDPSAYESALLDPPVAVMAENEPLFAVLGRLLHPLELDFSTDPERIVVTSRLALGNRHRRCFRLRSIFAGEPREPRTQEWNTALAAMLGDQCYADPCGLRVLGDVAVVETSLYNLERLEWILIACREIRRPGQAPVRIIPDSFGRCRLYDVRDLLDNDLSGKSSSGHSVTDSQLESAVQAIVTPQRVEPSPTASEPTTHTFVAVLSGSLYVDATPSQHEDIERLLSVFRTAAVRPAPVGSLRLRDDHLSALLQPTTLAPNTDSLSATLAELARQHRVPIAVSDTVPPVSGQPVSVFGAPFETALDWLLRAHQLSFAEGPQGLLIEPGDAPSVVRWYDFAGLLPPRRPGLSPSLLPPDWRDMLRKEFPAYVRPRGVWDVFDHLWRHETSRSVAFVPVGDRLVVRGPRGFHRLVERLLAAERAGTGASLDDPWRALHQPVTFAGKGLPLGAAVAQLARDLRVPLIDYSHGDLSPPDRAPHATSPEPESKDALTVDRPRSELGAGTVSGRALAPGLRGRALAPGFAAFLRNRGLAPVRSLVVAPITEQGPVDLPPAPPSVTLEVRDMPLREVVLRLCPPPLDLDLIVADEMLVVVPRKIAAFQRGFAVFDARRTLKSLPAFDDETLVELLPWSVPAARWHAYGKADATSNYSGVREPNSVACFGGWLVVSAWWREQVRVSAWLNWLERAAPTLAAHGTSGKPTDLALLMRHTRGDDGPLLRGFACWRLHRWSDPDEATRRTAAEWLRGCTEPDDSEDQLLQLVSAWSLPADAIPWVLQRLNQREFAHRRDRYLHLLTTSGEAGRAKLAELLRGPTSASLQELLSNAGKDVLAWGEPAILDALAYLVRPAATAEELERFVQVARLFDGGLSGLIRHWLRGTAQERTLAELAKRATKRP